MKQKNMLLMVVAVGCGLVAAFLTTQINAKPKIEQVEVWVATKDLTVGTMLSQAELPKLAAKKKVNKESLPPAFIIDEAELVDKRLTRPMSKEEVFSPAALAKGGVITPPEGLDVSSLPMNALRAAAGFVGPGSKVNVLATLRLGNQLKAFPLLVDMLVLAVDTQTSYDAKQGVFPNMGSVVFALTQEQALLLALAKKRGCELELLLRHPGKPLDPTYDIKKMQKLLQDDLHPVVFAPTDKGEGGGGKTSESPIAPTTDATPSVEKVKVLIAKEDIAADTEITKDLVAQKFIEKELPKEFAEGAYSDLSPVLGQHLENGLGKGQWVTETLVGRARLKPAPQDEFSLPKDTAGPAPKPVGPQNKRTHDVAVHTTSGTVINRFEEVRPGEWKLKSVLSPVEATAKQPKEPTTQPETGAGSESKKID